MSGELFVGFDVGTQGTKGVLVDADGAEIVARASSPYGLIEGLPAGAAEQHPDTWIRAVSDVARALFRERPRDRARVRGIGVAGQQHGLVVLDGRGRVLRAAKLWCDTSTADEAAELSQRFGRRVPCGYTAPKILWLLRREPETFARIERVLLPHDYVNFALCGRACTDAGDASGTGLFDPVTRTHDFAAAARIDERVPQWLAQVAAADDVIGELSREGAELTGLPIGVPVSAGSGDNMCSALGSGATRPGVLVVSLGTSGTAFAYAARAHVDPEGLVAPFCDATGAHLPLLCVMNASGVADEVARAFGRDHADLARAAEAVEPGARGVTWLPFLAGERVPDLPHASGVIRGLRAGSLDASVLYRAAIEGVVLNLAAGIERLRRCGVDAHEVRAVGGAAKSPLWCRILADVLGVPVVRLAEPESAALGAAIQSCWAVRRARGERISADEVARAFVRTSGEPIEPREDAHAFYRDALARFDESVQRAYGVRALP